MATYADHSRSVESSTEHRPPEPALPHSLSLLCVSPREPSWANITLQFDAHGCRQSRFRWVSTAVEMLAALRDESFDCVIIQDAGRDADGDGPRFDSPHEPFDGLEFLRALRAGGHHDPVVVLTRHMSDRRLLAAFDLECTVLTTLGSWESRALVPFIRSELQRDEMKRDNYRLSLAQRRRLLRERDETEHLLGQQRQILDELQGLVESPGNSSPGKPPPSSGDAAPVEPDVLQSEEVGRFYDELLRTYVMMGSGRLGTEISRLATILAEARVSPRAALGMHLKRVEKLVRGLGSRSSRHVLTRADLLALELVIQLGECYRVTGCEPIESPLIDAA
ncbi:MAG: hypothetical protein ACE5KM_00330 [Planctomycetaceae bacterium]